MKRLALVGLLGAAACVSGTLRPVRPGAEFQVDASPPAALEVALGAVTALGLPLRLHDPEAGVVETNYTDIVQYYPEASQFPLGERLVRFRLIVVLADTGYGSTVAIEARYSPFMTGGDDTSRNRERAIPRDHPAMEMVRELQAAITTRAHDR